MGGTTILGTVSDTAKFVKNKAESAAKGAFNAGREILSDGVGFVKSAVTGREERDQVEIRDTEMVTEIKKFQRALATQILSEGEVNRYFQNKGVDELLKIPYNATGLIDNPELPLSPSIQAAARVFLHVSVALENRKSAVRAELDIGDGAVRYHNENKHDRELYNNCKKSIESNKTDLFNKASFVEIIVTFFTKGPTAAYERCQENNYEKITKASENVLEARDRNLGM